MWSGHHTNVSVLNELKTKLSSIYLQHIQNCVRCVGHCDEAILERFIVSGVSGGKFQEKRPEVSHQQVERITFSNI